MLIKIGFDIVFDIPAPTPFMTLLNVHPSRAHDLLHDDRLKIEPGVYVEGYTDSFNNRCNRFVAPAGKLRLSYENIVRDSGVADEVVADAVQVPVERLPAEVMPFLLASRYCEVDRMTPIAWDLFGKTKSGWERAQAVCDYVHSHVQFGYPHARPTKTAYECFEERKGVCRDFMHLAITLLRCLNIPARYATGYLGDIGVPIDPNPMDFSAWYEVYLSGRWFAFDARHNMPRIGRILMARGRDAVDAALTTTFGPTKLEKFSVVTDEVKPHFIAS
jgi:transglutaminase-like putative cysteine protease